MKSLITTLTLILMLISIRAFSQLSTFDSNTGSGNIFESKNNGIAKILDYDVSKTEVGFTLQNAKRSGRKVGVWAADVSFGLDKQTFLLLDKNGINPGASIAGGYSRKYDTVSYTHLTLPTSSWV